MHRLRLLLLILLPLLTAASAAFGIHGVGKRTSAKEVSRVCTLGHYRARVRPLAANHHGQPGHGKHKREHRTRLHRVDFKIVLSSYVVPTVATYDEFERPAARLPRTYTYLYFQEINPPPPKAC